MTLHSACGDRSCQDSNGAVQNGSWLPEASPSLAKLTSAAESLATHAAGAAVGLFSKKGEEVKSERPEQEASAGAFHAGEAAVESWDNKKAASLQFF